MKRVLFDRFLIKIDWSTEDLWWDAMEDGHKQTYLFDVSTISRKMDGKSYQGLQIIIGKLAVRIADLNSIKPASEINQLTEIEKHGQDNDQRAYSKQ